MNKKQPVLMPWAWWNEIAILIREMAQREGEDVVGLFLKRGVFHRLTDKERMALADMVEDRTEDE